jgi:two-component system chemotaxis response regulator CheY
MNIANARVMVVDDEEIMRSFVVGSLRRMGVQTIETCVDGASALKLAPIFKPDVVLTDIHMEPMGGIDFVKVLRRHPSESMRKLRVIFMSADASKGTLEEALPLGTFGYIVKPPRPETLRAKLELALK